LIDGVTFALTSPEPSTDVFDVRQQSAREQRHTSGADQRSEQRVSRHAERGQPEANTDL